MHSDGNQNPGPDAPTLLVEAIEQQVPVAIARVRRDAAFTHAMIIRTERLAEPRGTPLAFGRCAWLPRRPA